ncbi:uncharacterized protein LOC114350508 [Ostrinia furnacalis]|uniref:uncharacterized protein LOC114350508 n=1 Tax=Ostrinia furnacalis TaxID=93504 RepID=UPI0010407792|nr:uncharacterized protein LOC114350508 [Ostrinia furnacalis]
MKKHKENLFAEKFHLLSSQQSEDITWSSSESSDFETNPPNVDKLCNITNRKSIKRKRKQTVPKNISNLDVTIVDVNKDAKRPSIKVEIEDPLFKSENEISGAKSPILGSTQYFPPYQCKNIDTSPIITTKSFENRSKVITSPILVLKAASPKISPNVRKKLFENKKNISENTADIHKSKLLTSSNNNYCLDRRKVLDEEFNNNYNKVTKQKKDIIKSEINHCKEENSELQSIKCELSSQKSVKFDNTDEIEILETQQSSNFENTPRKLNLDESVSMLKTSSTELAKKVESYFDCHFSSENASQNTISEVSTPKNNSRSSDDIEILTITTQVVSKSSMESMKPEIEVTTNKKEKKIRYKKDGLAYRLNSLVKKQAASISLWHHEKFLAANSNFFIPKGEFLGFRICKIHFKYGCYLLEAMDTNDDNFMIFINKCHMTSETISEDSILKLYEPYKMLSFNNNCKYVINVVKFEFVNIKK